MKASINKLLRSLLVVLLISTEIKGVVGGCSRPTSSEYAVVDEETYEESTARLKCHPGYEPTLESPRIVICLGDRWRPSPSTFRCQKKSCGNPGDIYNGHYDFSNGIEFGAVITASCKSGYHLIGESNRTCLANGEWDGRTAVCEVVKCGPPPIVPNGHTQNPPKAEYEFGEAVEYDCSSGYTLLGDSVTESTVHCLSNASWSHVPRCKMVNCSSPIVPHARRVEGASEPYGYGDSVRYRCDDGYRMVNGTGNMVCQEHGWTLPPICKGVVGGCSRPTSSEYAVLDEETYEEASTARLKCHPGYEPTLGSPRTIVCSGGRWRPSPSSFRCQKKSCGNPGDIYNGQYDFSKGIAFGAVITASCKPGYHLIGESKRTCLANGEWDGRPAVCEVVKCGPPPIVPNGHTQNPPKDEYEYGEVVEYDCSSGYTLLGDSVHSVHSVPASTVHCLSNASWSHVPRCKMVNCNSPIVPHAQRVEGGTEPYGYGDSVRYRCDDGYRMVEGTGNMVCQEHGWSSPPICKAVCTTALGLKDGRIKDGQMTASSFYKEEYWKGTWTADCARLDKGGRVNAWSPNEDNRLQWLQVDLGSPKTVTGIITQGAKDLGAPSYVTKFKVEYSNDGSSWTVVSSGGKETIFQGNSDNDGHRKNLFDPPFDARFVRFLPWDWHERITLRMELLGC